MGKIAYSYLQAVKNKINKGHQNTLKNKPAFVVRTIF